MRKGAYSQKFRTLEKEAVEALKEDSRAIVNKRKEKEREISRETNKRRRYLASKKKALEDVEERKRQEILAIRREQNQDATVRFQRHQKIGSKRNVKGDSPGTYPLRDGVYNIRGHIVEIKDGTRAARMPTPVDSGPMRNETVTREHNTTKSNANMQRSNAIYSGKTYLLNHLNDLVNPGKETKCEDEAVMLNRNEANGNHDMKKRIEPDGSAANDAGIVGGSEALVNGAMSTKTTSDLNLSSPDSLETKNDIENRQIAPSRQTPKSSLRNREFSSNDNLESKEKRKVKFNNSIEFNDGFVWMLKDNEQKPSFDAKKNNTPSVPLNTYQNKANAKFIKGEVERRVTTMATNGKTNGNSETSFSPALPRYNDYSYPESVDLPKPVAGNFEKTSSSNKLQQSGKSMTQKHVDGGCVATDIVLHDSIESSPTDSLEMAKDDDTSNYLDLNDDELQQRHIPDTCDPSRDARQTTELRNHAPDSVAVTPDNKGNAGVIVETNRDARIASDSNGELITLEQKSERVLTSNRHANTNKPSDTAKHAAQGSSQEYMLDNRALDNRALDNRPSHNRALDSHGALDNRALDSHGALDNRTLDNRTLDNRASHIRALDNRVLDSHGALNSRALDNHVLDNRALENNPIGYEDLKPSLITDNDVTASVDRRHQHHITQPRSHTEARQHVFNEMQPAAHPIHSEKYYQGRHKFDGYQPRTAFSAVTAQPQYHTAADRSSLLSVRGNSYFPARPSLQGEQRNTADYRQNYATDFVKYQHSQQTANVGQYSSNAATSNLHATPDMYESGLSEIGNSDAGCNERDINGKYRDGNRESVKKDSGDDRVSVTRKEQDLSAVEVGYTDARQGSLKQGSVHQNVPFSTVSEIDLEQVIKRRNGSGSELVEELNNEDDDDIISNVRKSMAELKFGSKWEPVGDLERTRQDDVMNRENVVDRLGKARPSNKAKIIEQGTLVSDVDNIEKQRRIAENSNKKTSVPNGTNSDRNAPPQRRVWSGKAAQKPGLVPRPPAGPKGRLFPRKRPPSEGVIKRGSPMKVVNSSRVGNEEATPAEKSNFRTGFKSSRNEYYADNTSRNSHGYNGNYENIDNYSNYANDVDFNGNQATRNTSKPDSDSQQVKLQEDKLIVNGYQNDQNARPNPIDKFIIDKTPTDDEINELWYDVQSVLKTQIPDKASSDTVYMSSPWRQQQYRRWSGGTTRNAGARQTSAGTRTGQNMSSASNRSGSAMPLRRYGSHGDLRRENSLDNLTNNVRLRGRSATSLRGPKQRISPSVQAFSIRKSTAPEPFASHQAPISSKAKPRDVSESLASFLALEAMCQQESLSPYHTSAVLKATQNAYKEMKIEQSRINESPVSESRRQEPSSLSIEERKVMESLDRLNSRLREKEAESHRKEAATKWKNPLVNCYTTATTTQNAPRTRSDAGISPNFATAASSRSNTRQNTTQYR